MCVSCACVCMSMCVGGSINIYIYIYIYIYMCVCVCVKGSLACSLHNYRVITMNPLLSSVWLNNREVGAL